MSEKKSNAEIVHNTNVRLCRLRIWPNYKGLGFHLRECLQPPHLINLVESNSPAAAGGLKISDVLLAVNNKTVFEADYDQVTVAIKAAQKTSRPIELLVVEQRFYKSLKKKHIIVDSSSVNTFNTPTRMPDDYINFPKHIPRTCHIHLRSKNTNFGFNIVSGDNDIGLYIQEVFLDSPAYNAGLRKCDRTIEIDDKYIDKDGSKSIIEKLGKAAARRTVKLLVADTETYGCYVLNNPDIYESSDTSHVHQAITHEKLPASSEHRSRNDNESLTSNRSSLPEPLSSTNEYISLHDEQRLNKSTTTPQAKNRDYHEEFHSLNSSLNQNNSPVSHRQDESNLQHSYDHIQVFDYEVQEISAEYEVLDDNNSSTTNLPNLASNTTTSRTSHLYENIPSHTNHQIKATTALQIEQNDESIYLEPSSITLDFDYKQSKNDSNIQEDGNVTNEDERYQTNQRFFDVENEPLTVSLPIEGYEDIPSMPLNIAIESLEQIVPRVKQNAWIALERSPSDGLTSDESASIQLYTMEWKPNHQSLSIKLNAALRSEDRNQLTPYFTYFKLILTALFKLKSVTTTAWRGANSDLSTQYSIGKVFIWSGFSSCMESRDLLESTNYLDPTGIRTLFNIQCHTGKCLRSHSYSKSNNEILLLPNTQFQVINQHKIQNNLYIIDLKEIQSEYISQLINPTTSIIQNENKLFQYQHLQEFIEDHRTHNSISFPERLLTTNDMYLITNELQTNQFWCGISFHQTQLNQNHIEILMNSLRLNLIITYLDLSSNHLDDYSVLILSHALKSNIHLESIDLSDNNITEIGARSFGHMLVINKSLLNLNLSENPLGDIGISLIAQDLIRNMTLVKLYLDGIGITIVGIRELTNMIRINQTLTYLSLKMNQINDESMNLFLDGLQYNNSLTYLYFNNNKITDQCIEGIINVLEMNKTLKCIQFYDNQLTEQGKLIINEER